MKFLKTILDFYINTSIHVAVAVFSLIQITKLQLNIFTNSNLDYFIFFGTILGYNFLKYFAVFWNRVFTFNKNLGIVLVSMIAIFGIIFYFFRLDFNFQLEFFKIGILILIYPIIRKYGLIKMVFVSFCLTLITVYVPIMNETQNWIYLIQRFLVVFCLLIPLEICNLEIDSKTIKTLPKIIGIQNLKILGYFLLLVFCFLQFAFCYLSFAFLVAIAIFFSDVNRSKYYTSFWVESLPVVLLGLLLFRNGFQNFISF
jgi:hypothetical protein